MKLLFRLPSTVAATLQWRSCSATQCPSAPASGAPTRNAFSQSTEDHMTDLLHPSFRLLTGRRSFLRRSGGALLSASAIALLAGREARAASGAGASDAGILNTMLGSEYEAVAAYQVGAESGLLQKPVLDIAVGFQGQHKAHADFLAKTIKKLGGRPVEPKQAAAYKFPVESQTDVLRFAADLEHGAATAYLGTVPRFSNRDLAKDIASILGDEAMHWAVLRQALNENPVPQAYIS
jgi:ferritin-like protein